jgi:hypothetical protein
MIRDAYGHEPQYTCEGKISATGFGGKESAYERLLLNLCKSGCTLPEIRIVSSILGTIIFYKVQGTGAELDEFRSLVER